MKKEVIIYDSTSLWEQADSVRAMLAEEQGVSLAEVTEEMIDDVINDGDSIAWDDAKNELEAMFAKDYFLLVGTCGRWNGKADGGEFIDSMQEFTHCIAHLDGVKITDNGGHLMIEGYHHDGHDHYELKKLTNKGYNLASYHYFENDRKLHNTIFNNNFYSALPRLATAL